MAAISVNWLYGLTGNTGTYKYKWLRRLPPDARIGYSIYTYDLCQQIPAASSAGE